MSYEWKQIFLWYKKKREQDKDQLNNPPGLQNFYKIIRLLDRKTNQTSFGKVYTHIHTQILREHVHRFHRQEKGIAI